MKLVLTLWLGLFTLVSSTPARASSLQFPKAVEAGTAFSVATTGSGMGTLYIVGPGGALKRSVRLGETVSFARGDITCAGRFTAFLIGPDGAEMADFDVVPTRQPSATSFLAKPSRLAVNLPNGISGVVYVFDVFGNLMVDPLQVAFQLSVASSAAQTRVVQTQNGVAWIKMNSAAKAGPAQFQATAGGVTDKRIIQQVPGDPCNLRMSARRSGDRIALETEPVRDCSGNPVPDGTVITFTEAYQGTESTVDEPLKRGVARTDLPAHDGAVISVATGVVMGNEIHWQDGK